MKKLIIIMAIVACATVVQAQSRNPYFAPFNDSMRIAAAMRMSERTQETPPPQPYQQPESLPEVQYVYTEDGHLIILIPTGPGTFQMFRMW